MTRYWRKAICDQCHHLKTDVTVIAFEKQRGKRDNLNQKRIIFPAKIK